MAITFTPNYNLGKQEDKNDNFSMDVITENMDKIDAALSSHELATNNPHGVTKTQIGLSNVDNTSDIDKPISTLTQTALNLKADNLDLTTHISNTDNPHNVNKDDIGLSNVVNVDTTTTANITDSTDKRFVSDAQKTVLENTSGINTGDETTSTIQSKLGVSSTTTDGYLTKEDFTIFNNKANIEEVTPISHVTDTSNPHSVTKAQVGLGNVDNTSDLDKPISNATSTALDNKVDKVTGKGLSTNDYTNAEKDKLAAITNPIKLKGRVDSISYLPAVAEIGWLYFVGTEETVDKEEYVYTEEGTWEHIGTSAVDLSDYYTKSEVNTAISNKADSTELTTHTGNADIHVTAEDKTAWSNKADSTELTTHTGNADIHVTAEDKTKLNSIETGAKVNVQSDWNETDNESDAFIKNKPTSLPASDVSTWAKEPVKPTYTASEVGLGNVDNTADTDKPISTATQTALDTKASTTTLTAHTGNADIHVTAEDKTAWNNKADRISDNETVEDKTWSSSKIASEIPTTVAELTDSSSYAKTAEIAKNGTPVGCIFPFAGTNLPAGYLLCNGASYKVADYPDLYAAIGNKYGGDTANFNVPNLVDKFIQGSTTSGTAKAAGLPNITGVAKHFSEGCIWSGEASGAFNKYAANTSIEVNNVQLSGSKHYGYYFSFDASRCSTIYGNSSTVQPPALTMIYIIKAKYIYA